MRLSDSIEEFIKTMLGDESTEVEVRRNELAEYFRCAPSQINYVLATRFSLDHGYLIESHRGGGGYIRITRVVQKSGKRLTYLINERIGDEIAEEPAARLLMQLREHRIVTDSEAEIMTSAISAQAMALPLPESIKDAIRARIMKAMLRKVAALKRDEEENSDAL